MITLGSSYKLLEILKRYLRMTLEKVELYCQNSEEFFGESYTGKDRLILIFFFFFILIIFLIWLINQFHINMDTMIRINITIIIPRKCMHEMVLRVWPLIQLLHWIIYSKTIQLLVNHLTRKMPWQFENQPEPTLPLKSDRYVLSVDAEK